MKSELVFKVVSRAKFEDFFTYFELEFGQYESLLNEFLGENRVLEFKINFNFEDYYSPGKYFLVDFFLISPITWELFELKSKEKTLKSKIEAFYDNNYEFILRGDLSRNYI